jgi:hypothetical protein
MGSAHIKANARMAANNRVDVSIENPPGGPLAFFLRTAVIRGSTRERILPVFYEDNYVSILPGEKRTLSIDFPPELVTLDDLVSIRGWNVREEYIRIE